MTDNISNRTKIKFCGLRSIEDALAAAELGASYAGFILSPRFRRYADPEVVRQARTAVQKRLQIVGVFVDEDVSYVARMVNDDIIDIAQLHGSEDEEYIRRLRELTGGRARIIKVFVAGNEDIAAKANASSADLVLIDSGTGSGKTFDWTAVSGIKRDFILAGGLNPSKVGEAVRKTEPFAVDVSSGVETDGTKDHDKMALFARNAFGAGEDKND